MTAPAYATIEQVAAALDVNPSGHDTSRLRRLVHSASRTIDRRMHRWFYPLTATYTWRSVPTTGGSGGSFFLERAAGGFWLNRDLLSLTSATSDGSTVDTSTITYRPNEAPYSWAYIVGSDIDITGVWGYSQDNEPAGALDGAMSDTTGTSLTVTDSSLVGIGDLLIIDTERLVVTDRTQYDTTANITADLTAAKNDNSVTVNDGTLVNTGETIRAGTEDMLITGIATNTLTVIRAVNGSTLAAHSQPVDVYAPRTLTVERGAAGSTAATHLDAATITRNRPPEPINTLCIAEAMVKLSQETSSYGRTIGSGEGTQEMRGLGLKDARAEADHYRRLRMAAV
jgi:hypothetical protein